MRAITQSFCVAVVVFAFIGNSYGADFSIEQTREGVAVKIDGELFTQYLFKSGNKPIMYPILDAGGAAYTRDYPMKPAGKHERADHPHHRSLWFTHGDVNGVSFWHEGNNAGEIAHRKLVSAKGGATAVIVTENDWLSPKRELFCQDTRTVTCGLDGKQRYIDFDITISAADTPVKFGDTKEGSFGVRVAGTMKVDAQLGGQIVNSEGQKNKKAWGQAAAWVDYYGPASVDKRAPIVGVAILNHPSSFRHPTFWHVRTYGLFAANVFGLRDFNGSKQADGSHTLQPGDRMTFRHRVLLHRGDAESADIAAAYKRYAATE